MPDLTPDVTTTPNFDPGRVAIASGWLVYDVGYHTCGGYGPESGYAHEPGCGAEPMCEVTDIPDLLAAAAERDALAESVRAYGRTIDRWGLLIIAATHSEDITTPDGDGDWEVIESRLAEVPALLAEVPALLAERDALAAAVEHYAAQRQELRALVSHVAERLDAFTYDELAAIIGDEPLDQWGERYRAQIGAERDALAAKLDAVREWIDRRGVNVDDRDDDYMRGYRDAQRYALHDANELRALLDATPETGGES